MPDVSAPAKFMTANSQRSTPSPTTSINSRNASPDAIRCERSQASPRASARSLVHSLASRVRANQYVGTADMI